MFRRAPLQIVHVVRQFHPGVGGIENFVEQLAARQARGGNTVSVVTLDRIFNDPNATTLSASETYHGVDVVRIPYKGSKRYPLAPKVLAAIKRADLVHVHGVDFFADFLAATAWFHRKPMVLTTHGGFFHTSFAKVFKTLYFKTVTKVALSRYAAVVACGDSDAMAFGKIAGKRLVTVPNPVDIDKFENLSDRSSSTLIYFGRLAPNKEIERLINWFGGLAASDPKWRLIIAGKPMGVDPETLRRQAHELGLEDRVEVHGQVNDDELKALIARSGAYCCASSYEGFGLAAVEAASAGLFPLLSRIPAFVQTVQRLRFGMLVDFDQPESWPNSYRKFAVAFDGFRAASDDHAIRNAVNSFSWSAAVPAYDDVYDRVLGRSKRRIGAVDVDVLAGDDAANLILASADARKPMMVAFCNAHTANLAGTRPELAQAIEGAVVLNDGVGVDLASRALFGAPFPENLNGTDFVPHMIGSAEQPLKIFMLGSDAGTAELAAGRLRALHPNATVVGTEHGFFAEDEEGDILSRIRESDANMVLVGMGQPRQELWAARNFEKVGGPVLCVGALFEFLAQRVPRAPLLIRNMRLEWAFRLSIEPRRLAHRYLIGNGTFIWKIVRQRLSGSRI
jgi:alpha-1,3-mannosyltransferase